MQVLDRIEKNLSISRFPIHIPLPECVKNINIFDLSQHFTNNFQQPQEWKLKMHQHFIANVCFEFSEYHWLNFFVRASRLPRHVFSDFMKKFFLMFCILVVQKRDITESLQQSAFHNRKSPTIKSWTMDS